MFKKRNLSDNDNAAADNEVEHLHTEENLLTFTNFKSTLFQLAERIRKVTLDNINKNTSLENATNQNRFQKLTCKNLSDTAASYIQNARNSSLISFSKEWITTIFQNKSENDAERTQRILHDINELSINDTKQNEWYIKTQVTSNLTNIVRSVYKLFTLQSFLKQEYKIWIAEYTTYKKQIDNCKKEQQTFTKTQPVKEKTVFEGETETLIQKIKTLENEKETLQDMLRATNETLQKFEKQTTRKAKLQKKCSVRYKSALDDLHNTILHCTNFLTAQEIREHSAANSRKKMLDAITDIRQRVAKHEYQIHNFIVIDGDDRNFLHLKEILLRALEDLDEVSSGGDVTIQSERKNAVIYVKRLYRILVP